MGEEELQNELNRLEISLAVPNIKLRDSNLPLGLNPFFSVIKESATAADQRLFGPKCSCRVRRNSESVLEDSRSTSCTSAAATAAGIERTIINHTQFKHKKNATRKVLVRESALRTVFFNGVSYRHNKNVCQKLAAAEKCSERIDGESSGNSTSAPQRQSCPTLEALNLDNSTAFTLKKCKSKSKSSIRSNLDFRSLIEEYQAMSVANKSISNRINRNLGLKVSNTKSFNTMQSSDSRIRNHPELKADRSRASCSTSCSQQARITTSTATATASTSATTSESTAPCDVTIDELASYFETFVHIPKKMSSMAEMMYI